MAEPRAIPQPAQRRLRSLPIQLERRLSNTDLPGRAAYTAVYDGRPVLVTVRLTAGPDVIARHQIEQDLYQAAAAGGCPLPLARPVHLDEYLTIVEAVPTMPATMVAEPALRDLLDLLDWLYAWAPTSQKTKPVCGDNLSVIDELDLYQQFGLVRPSSRAAIRAFLGVSPRLRLELGRLDADRLQFDRVATTAVIGPFDLAWQRAGHDWAQLHLRWSSQHPWLAHELQTRADNAGIPATYAAVLVMAACRNWMRHVGQPDVQQPVRVQIDAAQHNLRRIYEASV